MSAANIISDAESTGSLGDKESLREVLDFLVTEEQLGVTLVSAAIENAPGTPSEAFLPVLRNQYGGLKVDDAKGRQARFGHSVRAVQAPTGGETPRKQDYELELRRF